MCEPVIVQMGGRVGTFSFSTGFRSSRYPTLLEWAKADFDACMSYLFMHGMDDDAEVIFEKLVRTQVRH